MRVVLPSEPQDVVVSGSSLVFSCPHFLGGSNLLCYEVNALKSLIFPSCFVLSRYIWGRQIQASGAFSKTSLLNISVLSLSSRPISSLVLPVPSSWECVRRIVLVVVSALQNNQWHFQVSTNTNTNENVILFSHAAFLHDMQHILRVWTSCHTKCSCIT